ncbi:family 20 glycosylhydrolase [Lysobacter tyrosinilyticus]
MTKGNNSARRRVQYAALTLALALSCMHAAAAPIVASDVLVPMPASVQPLQGNYVPAPDITLGISGARGAQLRELKELTTNVLREAWDAKVSAAGAGKSADVRLTLVKTQQANPESYTLQIDSRGISIEAASATGLFYGLQTLRQLAVPGTSSDGIAAVRIEDVPRFHYRGLHLDVARHMVPVADIKRQLDLMARYKFNVFHWHLTDDQGWRLEIKRYPRLTEIGANRKETVKGHYSDTYVGDGQPYGGYYTQQQVREVVAYARQRHIEVIPEIDIPGHTVAALAAYPELACTPGPFEVRTTWGIDDNILCPSEQSFAFVQNVLGEVMALFPSKYLHLGGDEAPTTRWEQSPLAQSIIQREKLANEHALQGWFLRRIEAFVNAKGRRIIGWDEILDGAPSPTATVMSWRGMAGGIEAAQRGHDVIMSPTDYAYFDYCQGDPAREPICIGGNLPLSRVYEFEPVPATLTPEQARHILGGQANVWTEYLKTPDDVEYMLWPRALAMTEVLWSPQAARDWAGFERRLPAQLATLDRFDVNYRVPGVEGLETDVLSLHDSASLQLHSALPGAVIRYTLDGSEPSAQSPRYEGPIQLPLTDVGTVISARAFTTSGRTSPVASARYRRAQLQSPAVVAEKKLQPGLRQRYVEGDVADIAGLEAQAIAREDIATDVGIPANARELSFGLLFDGYLRVPQDGIYRFTLRSDDGSVLRIGDEVVVDRDGPRSPGDTAGSVALAAGLHPVALRYFQGGGGRALRLTYSFNGQAATEVPAAWWSHTR